MKNISDNRTDNNSAEALTVLAQEVQKDVLRMVGVAKSGPFATSMAAAGLLVYLYWEELRLFPGEPRSPLRDRFVFDLPEAVPALYAVLARRGYFEREHLWHYRRLGAMLQGLPDYNRTPGIDAPCVTVSPALALAWAMASELHEGQRVIYMTSEASFSDESFLHMAEKAAESRCTGLVMIVLTLSRGIMQLNTAENKNRKLLASRGWKTASAAGDFDSLKAAFTALTAGRQLPKAIFVSADSETGISVRGINSEATSCSLSLGEMDQALEELEGKANEGR